MDLAHEAPVASDSAPAPAPDSSGQHPHVLDVAGHLVPELVLFRRDLHANPELSRAEFRTTAAIAARLERAGLAPRVRGVGTGLVCDIVPAGAEKLPFLAFRADIDALPVEESNELDFRSRVPGVMHACGHDVHTAVVLGAGLTLVEMARAGMLARPVRLIFQPAEEVMPGGALDMVAEGALYGVSKILSVHCDPKLDAGQVGLRTGALTAACDLVALTLDGPGGHTSRPHLTADLVYALASIVAEVPAALSRRIDPRAGLSLVWGQISAGSAPNAIPGTGSARGTIRTLDQDAWNQAPDIVHELIDAIAAKFGVKHTLDYVQGVPPVVNEAESVALLRTAATRALGAEAVVSTPQSLGGEDFAWYLQRVPGAMARLGVRTPGDKAVRDLHQGTFVADEGAIAAGIRMLATAALCDWIA
ncbi:amidohydrolase [Catenulispora acidiphila DSM 44928]|uniref:Amidohydrolase n=1 Tax=Catenulispora acidiphila (strain DSM 44928 / JCM 14897 / NBRC 102108 / NRRL B-24433 / ID139908) TaxID=479433 RepID=C7Q0T8_CATAD|nr:amidohydrolase [Catenulispora acidiphila]ACU69716.1 amidohydrolase [Catenulispora acidiphila DSM 44928]